MLKRSIASRHIRSFLLLIALPTVVVILLTGYFFRKEIVRITSEQRYAALVQMAASLNSTMQEFEIIASALIHDRSLMGQTLDYIGTASSDQRYRITLSIDEIFNKFFILTKQLGSFSLFFADDSKPYLCRNYSGINFTPEKMDEFVRIGAEKPGFVLFLDTVSSGYETYPDRPVVSMVVNPPTNRGYVTGVKSLVLSFDLVELADFIGQKADPSRNNGKYISHTFLIGKNGIVLATRDKSLTGRPFGEIRARLGNRYLIMERPIETSGWTIAEAISVRSLTRTVDTLMWYVYGAMLLIVLLFIRYNSQFFAQIVKPLNTVIREMDAVATGNFTVRVEPCDIPELDKLGDSFNLMVAEIDALTSEIKNEQKERIKTEIEALRYQLNPHFLCNTLNSIRMMASLTKNDAIRKMTTALMTITEDNLSRDDTVYSLEHELKNLDSYVYIMKVRYGDTFEFFKDIDTSLLPTGVPAMILQPIVENAILHGLHGLPRPGTIIVAASLSDGVLRLDVRDNGFGMSPEVMEGLFENRQSAERGLNRIGLYNVRRRIILSFGVEYGVAVASYPGEGTVVTLTLPVLEATAEKSRYAAEQGA